MLICELLTDPLPTECFYHRGPPLEISHGGQTAVEVTPSPDKKRKRQHAFLYLVRRYPRQVVGVSTLLLLAGLSEAFGVASLLPLLGILTEGRKSVV